MAFEIIQTSCTAVHEELLRNALTLPVAKMLSVRTAIGYFARYDTNLERALGAYLRALKVIVDNRVHMQHLSVKEWSTLASFAVRAMNTIMAKDVTKSSENEKLRIDIVRILHEMLQTRSAIDPALLPQIDRAFVHTFRQYASKQAHHPWLMGGFCDLYQLTQSSSAHFEGMRILHYGKARSYDQKVAIFRFLAMQEPIFECGIDFLSRIMSNASSIIPPAAVEMVQGIDRRIPFRPASLANLNDFAVAMGLGVAIMAYFGGDKAVVRSSDVGSSDVLQSADVLQSPDVSRNSIPSVDTPASVSNRTMSPSISNGSMSTSVSNGSFSADTSLSLVVSTPNTPNSSIHRRKRPRNANKFTELLADFASMAPHILQALSFANYKVAEDDVEYVLSHNNFWTYMLLSQSEFATFDSQTLVRIWHSCVDRIGTVDISSGACYCLSVLVPLLAKREHRLYIPLVQKFTARAPMSSGALALYSALHDCVVLDPAFEASKRDLPMWLTRATIELIETPRSQSLPPLLTHLFSLVAGRSLAAVYEPNDATRYEELVASRDYFYALTLKPAITASTTKLTKVGVPNNFGLVLDAATESLQTAMLKCAVMGLLGVTGQVTLPQHEPAVSLVDQLSLVWFARLAAQLNFEPALQMLAAATVTGVSADSTRPQNVEVEFAYTSLASKPSAISRFVLGFPLPTLEVLNAIVEISKLYETQRSPRMLQKCIDGIVAIRNGKALAQNIVEPYEKLTKLLVQIVQNQSPFSRLRTGELASLIADSSLLVASSYDSAIPQLVRTSQLPCAELRKVLGARPAKLQLLAIRQLVERQSIDAAQLLLWVLSLDGDRAPIVASIAKRFDTTPQMLLLWTCPALFRLYLTVGVLDTFPFDIFEWTGPKRRFLLKLSGDELPPKQWYSDPCEEAQIAISANAYIKGKSTVLGSAQALLQLARVGFIPKLRPSPRVPDARRAIEQLLVEAAVPTTTAQDRFDAWKTAQNLEKLDRGDATEEILIGGGANLLLRDGSGPGQKEIREWVRERALARKSDLGDEATLLVAWKLPEIAAELTAAKKEWSPPCRELNALLCAPEASIKLDMLNSVLAVEGNDASFEYYALALVHTAEAVVANKGVDYYVEDANYASLQEMVRWIRRLRTDPACAVLNHPIFISTATQMLSQIGTSPESQPGYIPRKEQRGDLVETMQTSAVRIPYSDRKQLSPFLWQGPDWFSECCRGDGHSFAAQLCDAALAQYRLAPLGYVLDEVPVLRSLASAAVAAQHEIVAPVAQLLEHALKGPDLESATLAVETVSMRWNVKPQYAMAVSPSLVAMACVRTNHPQFGILCAELAWALDGEARDDILRQLYKQLLDDELRSDLEDGLARDASLRDIAEHASGWDRLDYDLVRYELGLETSAQMGTAFANVGVFKLASDMSAQLDDYALPWRLEQWSLPPPPEPRTLPEVLFSEFRPPSTDLTAEPEYAACPLAVTGDFDRAFKCIGENLFGANATTMDFRPAYAMTVLQGAYFGESMRLRGERAESAGSLEAYLHRSKVFSRETDNDLRHARLLAVKALHGDVVRELSRACAELREDNRKQEALGHALRLSAAAKTPEERLCAMVNEAETAWFLGERDEAIAMLRRATDQPVFASLSTAARDTQITRDIQAATNESTRESQATGANGANTEPDPLVSPSRVMCTLGEWSVLAKTEHSTKIDEILTEGRHLARSSAERSYALHALAKFCDGVSSDSGRKREIDELQELLRKMSVEQRELAADKTQKRMLQKSVTTSNLWKKELTRLENEQARFLSRAIEGYLLSMAHDPESYGHDMSRLIALWFLHAHEPAVCKLVVRRSVEVPSWVFVPWLNQLTSGLAMANPLLKSALETVLAKIGSKHPLHTAWPVLNLVYSAAAPASAPPASAPSASAPPASASSAGRVVWDLILESSRLSAEMKARLVNLQTLGEKMREIALRKRDDKKALDHWLLLGIKSKRLPVPTATIPVSPSGDYTTVPTIVQILPEISVANGLSAPKIITMVDSTGQFCRMLLKGGSDDLRQDAIMEQAFEEANKLLPARHAMRTYKVIPLGHDAGAIEFVKDTKSLMEVLEPLHERHDRGTGTKYTAKQARAALVASRESGRKSQVVAAYKEITSNIQPAMRWFFFEQFRDPAEWLDARSAWSRSVGVASIVGWVLGLGDRHCNNVLVDVSTGEVVHIDLGIAFEHGKRLRIPETVPFRLTRDVVDGMGSSGTRGGFTAAARRTLTALREKHERILTVLDVFRYDALYKWRVSPRRAHQQASSNAPSVNTSAMGGSESSEADSALRGVRKKLTSGLSVDATVSSLIQQATDPENLALLFAGWFPFY